MLEAVVIEVAPGGLFKVRTEEGEELTAHVAEEVRRVSSSVRPGDRVKVKQAARDPKRGVIHGVIK